MRFDLVPGWLRFPEGYPAHNVTGVAVGDADEVFVLTRDDPRVIVYQPNGDLIRMWGEGFFSPRAHGISIGRDGAVYCTDDGGHCLRKFSPEGELILTIGRFGVASDTGYDGRRVASIARSGPPFNRPTAAAVASNGDIYVADGYGNARVHRFSADGNLVLSWGDPGSGPGQFRLLHGIALHPDGRVLVADRDNERVQTFTPDGEFLAEWGALHPNAIWCDDNGYVYVAEQPYRPGEQSVVHGAVDRHIPGRVSALSSSGETLMQWGGDDLGKPDSFCAPHGICVDSQGDLLIADLTYNFVNAGQVPEDCPTFHKYRRSSTP